VPVLTFRPDLADPGVVAREQAADKAAAAAVAEGGNVEIAVAGSAHPEVNGSYRVTVGVLDARAGTVPWRWTGLVTSQSVRIY
jgi:hypothetical protein